MLCSFAIDWVNCYFQNSENLRRAMSKSSSPFHGPRRSSGQGQTPKTPSSPTIEQLLNSDATRWSATTLPTSPALARDHDPEEDHIHLQHKKSVLARVKEKAKRWRQNLGKKKQNQEGNSTPSWGVSLEDDHEDGPDGDPEYLGAPMYESEMAPKGLKETARQHPRDVTVNSEERTPPISPSEGTKSQEKENPPNSPKQKANEENKDSVTSPSKSLSESVTAKLAPAYETVTEKLAPAYATLSEKTHNIAAKFQSLTVSTPSDEQRGITDHDNQQKYDKGVSVKEYLYQKFEPGNDEKALSKVITEAISPKKSPDGKGVVEKVRDAVSSLLKSEEAAPSKNTTIAPPPISAITPSISTATPPSTKSSSAPSSSTNAAPASSNNAKPALSNNSTSGQGAINSTAKYPSSSYVHEAMEEENHGRILQAN